MFGVTVRLVKPTYSAFQEFFRVEEYTLIGAIEVICAELDTENAFTTPITTPLTGQVMSVVVAALYPVAIIYAKTSPNHFFQSHRLLMLQVTTFIGIIILMELYSWPPLQRRLCLLLEYHTHIHYL